MAKLVVGSRTFDMTSWNLSDIGGGTVTTDTASEVDVTGAGGTFVYQIKGSGFTTFDTNGFPTDGTVTGLTMTVPGKTPLVISSISISATDFMGFVNGHDANGLESAIFAGNDSFTGRAGDDVLLGFAGNDTFNLTKGGNDTAQGGDGNDTFIFHSAFTAADSVNGGTGNDKVTLDGDYSAGVTFNAATMTSVENIILSAGHSYDLTLDAATVTTGEQLIVKGTALTGEDALTIDGAAVSGNLRLLGGAGLTHFIGGSGDDFMKGGNGNNTFDLSAGGDDTVSGGSGRDVFLVGGALTSGDMINGFGGADTIIMDGDYSAGITLAYAQIKDIAGLQLRAGHDYDITVDAREAVSTVDASLLGVGDSLHFDASANTTVLSYLINGGAGDDVITIDPSTPNNHANTFQLDQGGEDTVTSHGFYNMRGTLDAGDRLDGISGSTLNIFGDYSVQTVFDNDTFRNFSVFDASGSGNAYNFVSADGNVAAGATLLVEGEGTSFTWDGSAETDGNFVFDISATVAGITGGAGDDSLHLYSSHFSTTDSFDGGGGTDTVIFDGQNANTIPVSHLGTHGLANVENLDLVNGAKVVSADGNFTAGAVVHVQLDGGVTRANFNGSAETDATFVITGGGAASGGQGGDTISLSLGTITGNGGADTLEDTESTTVPNHHVGFQYVAVSDSTSTGYDTIQHFLDASDVFDLQFAVTGVDAAVTSGALSTASFDADLAAAVGSAQLAANHAVIFTPDSGTLAGDHFLVIDSNGTAGYQAGDDLVIRMADGTGLTTANFTQV